MARVVLYHGREFGNITKARWAVFFDQLGIQYELNSTRFDSLSTYGWKHWDFYLPAFGSYAKVILQDMQRPGMEACGRYATTADGKGSMLLYGPPHRHDATIICHHTGPGIFPEYRLDRRSFIFSAHPDVPSAGPGLYLWSTLPDYADLGVIRDGYKGSTFSRYVYRSIWAWGAMNNGLNLDSRGIPAMVRRADS